MGAYTVLSVFSGAGGLDIGFERAGFDHLELVEFDDHCVATIRANRPQWRVFHGDVYRYKPNFNQVDVLIGGPPCQGFSLGGNRDELDPRNQLFLEMVRLTEEVRPRAVVIENVLNLRTMKAPWSGSNFADEISACFRRIGYSVVFDVFRVCRYGVPQTRRRFIFVAVKGLFPTGYELPGPDSEEVGAESFLMNICTSNNHEPEWGFQSRVHTNRRTIRVADIKNPVPIRISRTGSDGFPVRRLDEPFPAVDTATVWGWAAGKVRAERMEKDRVGGKFVRNADADVKLWRIEADEMRTFTHREYARLQTFPDDWVFLGNNKRDVHKQVGNAVPVEFSRRVALNVRKLLEALDTRSAFVGGRAQVALDF